MREKIKLVSSAGTGHFYTTTKNKKTMPDAIGVIISKIWSRLFTADIVSILIRSFGRTKNGFSRIVEKASTHFLAAYGDSIIGATM